MVSFVADDDDDDEKTTTTLLTTVVTHSITTTRFCDAKDDDASARPFVARAFSFPHRF